MWISLPEGSPSGTRGYPLPSRGRSPPRQRGNNTDEPRCVGVDRFCSHRATDRPTPAPSRTRTGRSAVIQRYRQGASPDPPDRRRLGSGAGRIPVGRHRTSSPALLSASPRRICRARAPNRARKAMCCSSIRTPYPAYRRQAATCSPSIPPRDSTRGRTLSAIPADPAMSGTATSSTMKTTK